MFSQDSSNVAIAKVSDAGMLSDYAQVSVPPDNSFIKCFPNSPIGDYGRPCGTFYTPSTSYPGGVAFAKDGKSAYALLNQNNTLAKIDLTAATPTQGHADPRRQCAAQHPDQQRRDHRLHQQRGRAGRHRSGLPDLLGRHAHRRRPCGGLRDHRHRVRGRSGVDEDHRDHPHRSASDRHGMVRQAICWSPIPTATRSR